MVSLPYLACTYFFPVAAYALFITLAFDMMASSASYIWGAIVQPSRLTVDRVFFKYSVRPLSRTSKIVSPSILPPTMWTESSKLRLVGTLSAGGPSAPMKSCDMTFSLETFAVVKTTLSVTTVLHKQLELHVGRQRRQYKRAHMRDRGNNISKECDAYSHCLPPIVIHDIFTIISLACIRLAATGIVTIAIPKHAKPWQPKNQNKRIETR